MIQSKLVLIMTDKEKLNSILRLRLFYSTEKELSEYIQYKLKGNHFNRFKSFQSNAYFCKFNNKCKEYTLGSIDLNHLLLQYDSTSIFFKKYIARTKHEVNKFFISYLLDYLYLDKTITKYEQCSKYISLCKNYDKYNKEGKMNIGILLLITYGIIPTFNNKTSQDIPNIIADFQKTYQILLTIAQSHKAQSCTIFKEILCLKEMRELIEKEQSGDKYLNRILLIHFTNEILNKIYALKKPSKLKEYYQDIVFMDFYLPRLWRCEDDAENIIWELIPLNSGEYNLIRNEIKYKEKEIRYNKYQVLFQNIGYKDYCYTIIAHPSFHYHNILKLEQPKDSISSDFTDIKYDIDNYTVKELTFTIESSVYKKPITLKSVKNEKILEYYKYYLDHKNKAKDFVDIDNQAEYLIWYEEIDVAISNDAIFFKAYDGIYKLDIFDENGKENIPGTKDLTHKDYFLFAYLIKDGVEYVFLCLNPINQNININELLKQTYFNKISSIEEIFYTKKT